MRRAFPAVRRADLQDVQRRFRRVQQRRRQRKQARLDWRCPGAVWAADFKERREPLEGRYRWILSIKDLGSRYQLAWMPLEEATAEAVQSVYRQLFKQHGPPLVMKSDNGGQFRDEGTKALLAEHRITPLYNPSRHPSYNGGVERANGQLAGYQEALAEWHGRPGLPTCEDAENARHLANDLSRRDGLRGPTAREIWASRPPISCTARGVFLATVETGRVAARTSWNFTADQPLTHYQQAAVDRRAVRDALVTHDLLHILPRHLRHTAHRSGDSLRAAEEAEPSASAWLAPSASAAQLKVESAPRAKNLAPAMLPWKSACRIELSETASSMVDEAQGRDQHTTGTAQPSTEEAQSSTDKMSASGQHYG